MSRCESSFCVIDRPQLLSLFFSISYQVGISAGYSGAGVSAHASVKVGVNKQTAAKNAVEKEEKDVKVRKSFTTPLLLALTFVSGYFSVVRVRWISL